MKNPIRNLRFFAFAVLAVVAARAGLTFGADQLVEQLPVQE